MVEIKTKILPQGRNPFRKFPISAFLGLLAALVFLLQLTEQGEQDFSFDVIVVALQVAFIGSVAATILCRMGGIGENLCHIAALSLAGLFFLLAFIIIPQSLYWVVMGGFGLLLMICAPCFYKQSQDQLWWHGLHVMLASFLSLVVFAFWVSAFYTIEWMVQTLFSLGVSLATVRDIVPALGLALASLFFLSALPAGIKNLSDDLPPIEFDPEFSAQMRALFDFLLVPIIFLASLVLHLYAAAILLRQTFPDGQIGKIVVFYICLVLAIRFLIYPFLPQARLPSRIFHHIWALLLIVPLILLLVALTLRFDQYGMTINRYYLYVGSLVMITIMLAQILPRWRHDIRLLPLIPGFFLIASIFGPWSVQNWVGLSQAHYLIHAYEKQGRLNFSNIELYDKNYHDIAQHVSLLDDTGQLSRLLPYVEKNNKIASHFIAPPNSLAGSRPDYEAFMQALGAVPPPILRENSTPHDLTQAFAFGDFFANRGAVVNIEDYDKIVPFLFVSSRSMNINLNNRQFVTMRIESPEELALRYRDIADKIALREFMVLTRSSPAGEIKSPRPVDLRSQGGRHIRLIPLEIHVDGEGVLKSLNVSLMLKEEEWQR